MPPEIDKGIDKGNVQSLIARPYHYPLSRHFLFECGDAAGTRRFLAAWVDHVTSAAVDLSGRPDPVINISFTWQGLKALGLFDASSSAPLNAEDFPVTFCELPDVSALGAYGESDPKHWWCSRFCTKQIHLSLHMFCQKTRKLESASKQVRQVAEENGLTELKRITGKAIPGGKVHFGYRDGISQPEICWDRNPQSANEVDVRSFVLGYHTNDIQSSPEGPPGSDFVRDGCYLAFTWIYQDVARFRRFLRDNASRLGGQLSKKAAEELLAAKLVGRWRDGTPLVLSPNKQPDSALITNDFNYSGDLEGLACPHSAHIRVTNPRDQPLDFVNDATFKGKIPRITRRGMPYGPVLKGNEDDGVDRGLIGMFLCTDINSQFYPLTRWIRTNDFSPVFDRDPTRQDPLFGSRDVFNSSSDFSIPAATGEVTLGLMNFVRTQGVALLLLPSLATLRSLSKG